MSVGRLSGILLIAGVLFMISGPEPLNAQALNGSVVGNVVVGNVKDATDAAVTEAAAALTNTETKQTRQTVTSLTGAYDFATVPPGTYSLTVRKPGFSPFTQTNIIVNAAGVARVDVTMSVGNVIETVTVNALPAVLQTDSGEVRHELDAAALGKLPVPVGRNYQSLLSTVPGFTPPTNNHSVGTNPSRALYFAVNGGDHYQNNTRIDGATTMNVWLPDIVAMVPTLESIATVNVSTNSFDTNSFDAETGFTGIQSIANTGRDGIDERRFRFMLRSASRREGSLE